MQPTTIPLSSPNDFVEIPLTDESANQELDLSKYILHETVSLLPLDERRFERLSNTHPLTGLILSVMLVAAGLIMVFVNDDANLKYVGAGLAVFGALTFGGTMCCINKEMY